MARWGQKKEKKEEWLSLSITHMKQTSMRIREGYGGMELLVSSPDVSYILAQQEY